MRRDNSSRTLDDYLAVLRRDRWTIISLALLVPAVAVLLTSFQKPVYEASAEVALKQNDLAATLSGVSGGAGLQPERFTQTQARLARSPEIARKTASAVEPPYNDPKVFLRSSRVEASLDADILDFFARAASEPLAVELANAYATAYVRYANRQESAAVARALDSIDRRLAELRAAGGAATTQYTDLQSRRQQLQTYDALNSASAVVTQPAEVADKVSPRPLLSALFGVFLGLILGVVLAFGREAVNKPLRSPIEVAEELGLPLLGRIPRDKSKGVVTLSDPNGEDAEAYRLLCTSLEFAAELGERHAIVVTSAQEAEGKSTVASNVAVTLARRGMNVILVDGDVIQPSLRARFSLPVRPGLTDVATTPTKVDGALSLIQTDHTPGTEEGAQPGKLVSESRSRGSNRPGLSASKKGVGKLEVMISKPLSPGMAEVLLADSVDHVLVELRKRASIVIIDAPPLLTSIGMAWAAQADALLVVARLSEARRPIIDELGRALAQIPTAGLGVVVTDTSPWPGYAPSYGATPASRTVSVERLQEVGERQFDSSAGKPAAVPRSRRLADEDL